MNVDLENLEWIKWPTSMGFATLLYWLHMFYNSKRTNDKVDFDSVSQEQKDLINTYKAMVDELKKELQERDTIIDQLNNKINNKR